MRYAVRSLAKDPRFTIPAILALGVSIGANLSVFAVVDSVLLAPLPARHPHELTAIHSIRPDGSQYPFNLANYFDLRDSNRVMQDVAAYAGFNANLTGEANPERLLGIRVTANYFELLGVRAALGRAIAPSDDLPGMPKVVTLTWGLWERRYGGTSDILGRAIRLNGDPYIVIGVLPRGFSFRSANAEFAVPLAPESDPFRHQRVSTAFLRVIGRLKPGVLIAQARSDLDAVAAQLRREHPKPNASIATITALPLLDDMTAASGPLLFTLLAAVGFVLLIACANISSLWIARASARRKEMAIRAALGAGRWRLSRQTFAEALLLAGSGAALGTVLAVWGVPLLVSLTPAELPRAAQAHIGPSAIAAAAGAALLCALLLGGLPALQLSSAGLHERGATAGRSRTLLRSTLVVVEVALSLLLLVAAGLAMRSFYRLTAIDPGFRTDGLATFRLALPASRYRMPGDVWQFRDQLHGRLAAIPGVTAVGAASILPLSGPIASADFTIAGDPPVTVQEKPGAQYRMIDPGYFRAMQIPLLRGRDFTDRDTAGAPAVAIVSDAAAKLYWKGRDPVGSRIRLEDSPNGPREVEVVGVAGAVRELALEKPAVPCVFVAIPQVPPHLTRFLTNNFFWAVRTSPGASVAQAVRREIQAVDTDVAAAEGSMERYVDQALAARRFTLRIFTAFAIAALLLAGGGLFALVSYATAQRTREIGIRVALGARSHDVSGMVLRQGVALAAIGVSVGSVAAWSLARYAAPLLFEVNAGDGATLAASAALMVAIAAVASWAPARKAARIDPVEALRESQ
jgi:putative ABC transport system permease protein